MEKHEQSAAEHSGGGVVMWARFAATGSVLEFTKRRRGRRQGNDPKRVELMDLRMREKSNEEEEDS